MIGSLHGTEAALSGAVLVLLVAVVLLLILEK